MMRHSSSMATFSCLVVLTFFMRLDAYYVFTPTLDDDDDDFWMHSSNSFLRDQYSPYRASFESPSHWKKQASEEIQRREQNPAIEGVAKNAILFIGDGLSLPTISASRIYKGQRLDNLDFGEEASLHIDSFPFSGLSKTYCLDAQTADSACSATAYLGGIKSNIGSIGVKPNVRLLDCRGQEDPYNQIPSILHLAQLEGKSTGVVTNTRVTHASPAGAYAHVVNRDWEDDKDVRTWLSNPNVCNDIAKQLIRNDPGKKFNVVLGGGRSKFFPKNCTSTAPIPCKPGSRLDGRNLVNEWVIGRSVDGETKYVTTKEELLKVSISQVDNLIGLFADSHMPYYDEIDEDDPKDPYPSLQLMVETAIKVLSKNEKGFVLFVEGGRIDHAHHSNLVHRALKETVEFDKAVRKADNMTDDKDTLIVASSDHSHSMTFAGYHRRGNPILKHALLPAMDAIAHATLGYANGPGPRWVDEETGRRHDVSKDDVEKANYQAPSPIPMDSETHGGDDVGIFAKGPFAHFLSGVHEQTYIPHLISYAACLGDGPINVHCSPSTSTSGSSKYNAIGPIITIFAIVRFML